MFVYGKVFFFSKLSQRNENLGGVFSEWNRFFYPVFLVLNSLCFGYNRCLQLRKSYPNLSP
ncbi:hypothetical protein DQM68_00425 [Leptospira mayottensis]|uniref:Uncharacterized protein n=1 Tax=Leptospira mayottensis TaxID=1137606 RepID=A0ABN5NSC2_9LEPT|nr:hypothetical protein DQM68_00425 [Leptospira mayottensis]AXR63199.1 hypothetical protein DQM28_02055 [Leptospira mayottensis]AXR66959.1 hypothetical protein DPV73_01925 [Leptospira mayottensis]AZQ01269.1 hypothetical protein LEP1GSC190_03570 [Leptospira mayottensis 200901116]